MLAAVAPRWPRAFSVIGFGAAAIIIVYLSVISAMKPVVIMTDNEFEERLGELLERLLADATPASRDVVFDVIRQLQREIAEPFTLAVLDPMSAFVKSADPSELLVATVVSIFFAYVVGELVVALGRGVWVAKSTKPQVAMLGKIAKTDNAIIYREYENYASAFLIFQGTQVLLFLAVAGGFLHFINTGDALRFVTLLTCSIVFMGLVVFASVQNRRYVEAILSAFEAPEKTQTEVE
jgi:hypothetical protein